MKKKLFIWAVALTLSSLLMWAIMTLCMLLIRAIFGFGPHLPDVYHITPLK